MTETQDVTIDVLRAKVNEMGRTIARMQVAIHRKTVELDALHMVWCDGGCPSGVHRYQDEDVLVTEEMVLAAERNTVRLRHWYDTVKWRKEGWGGHPATVTEWHEQYAKRAASKTDLREAS